MHIKNLTQKGAFVVGFPIKHSLSPVIFHYWFKKYKIEAFYDKLQIAPENFEQFINQLKNSCGSFPEKKTILLGGNVTIPHKEKALIMADNCSLEAKNIGAANFLYFKEKICFICLYLIPHFFCRALFLATPSGRKKVLKTKDAL